MRKPSKTADSNVDWIMWSQGTPAIRVGVIVVGPAHSSRKVTILKWRRNRNRNKKVIWFNPPFCILTNINIGKCLLNHLDKRFNRDNLLKKFFNWNTVKVSYSCTKNKHNILNNHNRRLLDELNRNRGGPDVASCNCRSKGGMLLGRTIQFEKRPIPGLHFPYGK